MFRKRAQTTLTLIFSLGILLSQRTDAELFGPECQMSPIYQYGPEEDTGTYPPYDNVNPYRPYDDSGNPYPSYGGNINEYGPPSPFNTGYGNGYGEHGYDDGCNGRRGVGNPSGYTSGQYVKSSQEQLQERMSVSSRQTRQLEEQFQQEYKLRQQEQELKRQQEQTQQKQLQISGKKPKAVYPLPDCGPSKEGYTVNFENICVVQLIKFISQISGTNFIFNTEDLQFNISIISEDATSVPDLSATLMQILKMHGLSVVEQGNNVLIIKSPQSVSKVSTIITDQNVNDSCDNAVITRVFRLYNVLPEKIAAIVKSLVSPEAIVEPSVETRHLVVSDITANVNKIAELLAALDTDNYEMDIREYAVQNAEAQVLAEYAREILSPLAAGAQMTVSAAPGSRKIFIVAPPFILDRASQVLASLDVPLIESMSSPIPPTFPMRNNNFYMYKLKHQSGFEIATSLREIGANLMATGLANPEFANAVVSSQWVENNNSIIITGTDDAIVKVINLLNELDQLPKQVYIEVLILDTFLADSLDFGVQWIALGDEQNKLAFASGLLGTPGCVPNLEAGARNVATNSQQTCPTSECISPPLIPNPGRDVPLPNPGLFGSTLGAVGDAIGSCLTETFGLGIVGNVIKHGGRSFLTLGALISALDAQGDAKIVLNPKIMVEDAQPANFFVGQNIPYQTTSTVIQQTGSVTQNIQYEDIGVQLQVIPTIAPDNMVSLQISQVVSDVPVINGGNIPGQNLTPVTNKTLSTTRVHVPDGTFLVMSGQVRDTCSYVHSGIPCLGSLPLIGPAFSRTVETRQKRNLIFFIRPKVVVTPQQGIILTNDEGYNYNWDTNPCSIVNEGCQTAPECEVYPNPCWPPQPQPMLPPGPAYITPYGPPEDYPYIQPQDRGPSSFDYMYHQQRSQDAYPNYEMGPQYDYTQPEYLPPEDAIYDPNAQYDYLQN